MTTSTDEPHSPAVAPAAGVTAAVTCAANDALSSASNSVIFPFRCRADLSSELAPGTTLCGIEVHQMPRSHATLSLESLDFEKGASGWRVCMGKLKAQLICLAPKPPFKASKILLRLRPIYRPGRLCQKGVWENLSPMPDNSFADAERSNSTIGRPGEAIAECQWFMSTDVAEILFPNRAESPNAEVILPELDLHLNGCHCCIIGFTLGIEYHYVRNKRFRGLQGQLVHLAFTLTTPAARALHQEYSRSQQLNAMRRIAAYQNAPTRSGPLPSQLRKLEDKPVEDADPGARGSLLCAVRSLGGRLSVAYGDACLLQAFAKIRYGNIRMRKPRLTGELKAQDAKHDGE